MSDVRTESFELLRLGPPHNQLLSPLKEYIAKSGSHEVRALRVPWEHAKFLRLLRGLRYDEEGDEHRTEHLEDLGDDLAELIDGIPGVVEAVHSHGRDGDFLNLEVVVSAAELAMLPYEAAKMLPSCSSSQKWLCVQGQSRVGITRRIGTVAAERFRWPETPRILMIGAEPGALVVPMQQHVRALSDAVQPFVGVTRSDEDYLEAMSKVLEILPAASLASIRKTCREADPPFTHVHVLAHGGPTKDGSYGLLLEDSIESGSVPGELLVAALRDKNQGLPAVVTVSACDSGNVGDVVYSGASLAHELHKGQIPFVVASQLPLTFGGSEKMVRTLYQSFLWGEDPRLAVHELRQELHVLDSVRNHDWASIVCYAALPAAIEDQLAVTQYRQALRAFKVAVARLDDALRSDWMAGLPAVQAEIEKVMERMPDAPAYASEVTGLRAAAEKRMSESYAKSAQLTADKEERETCLHQMLEHLARASRLYGRAADEAMRTGPAATVGQLHWVLTQHLVLEFLLGGELDIDRWTVAKESARVYLEDPDERIWANGTLAELYMLRPTEFREEALAAATRIRDLTIPSDFERFSTVRQLRRYTGVWGGADFEEALALKGRVRGEWDELVALAEEMDRVLEGDETWRVAGQG